LFRTYTTPTPLAAQLDVDATLLSHATGDSWLGWQLNRTPMTFDKSNIDSYKYVLPDGCASLTAAESSEVLLTLELNFGIWATRSLLQTCIPRRAIVPSNTSLVAKPQNDASVPTALFNSPPLVENQRVLLGWQVHMQVHVTSISAKQGPWTTVLIVYTCVVLWIARAQLVASLVGHHIAFV